MSEIFLVGLSHQTAPLAVRERVALTAEERKEALAALRCAGDVREALLLCTCNRVEVFALADGPEPGRRFFLSRAPEAEGHLYERRGTDAVRHLFRVAASLDSMVLGEQQILGQVKEAYGLASAAGAAGPFISRLCNRAFAAAKRARTETEIGRGASSVSQVAVELAHKIFGSLDGRDVLLVGAGKMGALSAKALASKGPRRVLVTNRSRARAAELAAQTCGTPRDWEELPFLLAEADVVLVSTGAQEHVITAELVQGSLKARRHRSLCLIDLAVPRNVDPRCAELPDVYAYDMDDLQRLVEATRSARAEEARRAEEIVESEAAAFRADHETRAALPVLAALRREAEAVAAAEVQRTLAQLGESLDPRARKSVEAMGRAIVNKLLHGPTARLKAAAASGDSALPAAAAELFGIEPQRAEPAPVRPAPIDALVAAVPEKR